MGNKKTKSDKIVDQVRYEILTGDILPGAWLRQDELADRFDISSTPVREALRRLEAEGLVEHTPYQGVRVIAYTLKDIEDYFNLRSLLEGYAVQLLIAQDNDDGLEKLQAMLQRAREAYERGDIIPLTELNWAFHEEIIHLCDSRLLQDVVKKVWRAFQYDTLLMIPDRAKCTLDEHQAVVDAIRQGDEATAVKEMRSHIEEARKAIVNRLPGVNRMK